MSLLFTTTIMDSTTTNSNGEPPAKRYRYTSERHPFRIFESFNFDDLEDDNNDAEEGGTGSPVKDEVGHRNFAKVSRITKFTSERLARYEHCQQQQQQQQQARSATATVPRTVSITSMDDEDIADDSQQHNDATTSTVTATTTTAGSTATTTSTSSIPRNVSFQLFELTMSDAAARSTTGTTKNHGTKTNNASLPSLAHSSASSAATHLYRMDGDMMILEEE